MLNTIHDALVTALAMGWEILWALILGFLLSAMVQAVVTKKQLSRLLPDDGTKSLTVAALLGAASSSCSYAAVALARSLFRKGANFTAAIAFEIASTNLVIELGIVMALLLGWRFTLAEFVGGPIMIVVFAVIARRLIKPKVLAAAQAVAERGVAGKMEAHAQMDMAVTGQAGLAKKLASEPGQTATAHYFVMDWQAVWKDIVLGLLIAGAATALVPEHFWQAFFFTGHPLLSAIWGPIIGPLVAVISFVCSIGNVPLAAVLWNGGISFGGVIAFIFADLIVLPIINIYRKYYGLAMTLRLTAGLYLAMVAAGFIIEGLFSVLKLIPSQRSAKVLEASISWNYTTLLNIIFLALAAWLVLRFLRTGGLGMLKTMNAPAAMSHDHHHHEHHH